MKQYLDETLLELCMQKRHADAFATVVSRHARMVVSTCRRTLGDAADAEEVTPECLRNLATPRAGVLSYPVALLHALAPTVRWSACVDSAVGVIGKPPTAKRNLGPSSRSGTTSSPPSLDALSPQYFTQSPTDPIAFQPNVYRPKPGHYQLYSPGPYQIDNGGINDDWRRHVFCPLSIAGVIIGPT